MPQLDVVVARGSARRTDSRLPRSGRST